MTHQIRSESDASEAFCAEHRKIIRYVPEREQWIIKNGSLWTFDDSRRVDDLIRVFLRDQSDIEARWRGSLATVRNIKNFAESDPSMQVRYNTIDIDPLLLGTKTKIINLESGRRQSPRDGQYITRRTSVDPDYGYDCRLWKKFLNEFLSFDKEIIDYIHRWCGYLLTGSVKEHVLLILYGGGDNGKGVFLNTLASILDDYHEEATDDTFMESSRRQKELAMAHIAGCRFVTYNEPDKAGRWDEPTLKKASSGDPVTARFLYKNYFTYRSTYKIAISTNHLPKLKSVGKDMRRRVRVVEVKNEPRRRDMDLEEKLRAEHPAILAWMIEGTELWLKAKGLITPQGVAKATDTYFREQDPMEGWLRSRTQRVEGHSTPTAKLLESYNRYLSKRSISEVQDSVFGRQLRAKGYERYQEGKERTRVFKGIKLNS